MMPIISGWHLRSINVQEKKPPSQTRNGPYIFFGGNGLVLLSRQSQSTIYDETLDMKGAGWQYDFFYSVYSTGSWTSFQFEFSD